MQALETEREIGDRRSPPTKSIRSALTHLYDEATDRAKAEAEILGQIYSLTGAGS